MGTSVRARVVVGLNASNDPVAPLSHTAFLDRITYPTTRKYVEVILAKRDQYRALFANNRWYKDDASTAVPVTQTP